MATVPIEPFRRRLGDWLAISISTIALFSAISGIIVGAYSWGRWSVTWESRIIASEEYIDRHEADVKEKSALRTSEIATVKTEVFNTQRDMEKLANVVALLQRDNEYRQATANAYAATLERLTVTLNELVTKQEVLKSSVEQLREDLKAKGKL